MTPTDMRRKALLDEALRTLYPVPSEERAELADRLAAHEVVLRDGSAGDMSDLRAALADICLALVQPRGSSHEQGTVFYVAREDEDLLIAALLHARGDAGFRRACGGVGEAEVRSKLTSYARTLRDLCAKRRA